MRDGVRAAALLGLAAAALAAPVLELGFEAFDGKLALDASGQGNHAMVSAGMRVAGVRGTALDVARPGAGALCDDAPGLAITQAITLEAWVRPQGSSTGSFGTVIRKEESYALRFNDREIGLLLWSGGRLNSLNSRPLEIRPGRWMHVAGTYDGAQMRLYVDGQEVSGSPKACSGPIDAGGHPVGVGSSRGTHGFNGSLDEVRIYARALAPAEVAASHAAGVASQRQQEGMSMVPEPVGEQPEPLRKPPREPRLVVPGFLWIDAEDFADYGGWSIDTQFVYLMGSAYLLAAGVGRPVADAVTKVTIPEAGRYRIWVRSRNWVPGQAPGQFMLRLDGRSLPKVFGKEDSGEWVWEDGGERTIEAGVCTLALRDMTGYYGRCDAIILTTDLNYVPPGDRDAVCRERARLTELTLDPEIAGEFDVIVVGAGPAGSPAALAAARTGARTALIQDRPVLGGNASDECGVPLNGASSHHPNARETGIAEEVSRLRVRHGHAKLSEPFRLLAEAEPNLSVFVNQRVVAVDMGSPARIGAVRAVNALTGQISVFRGRFFIDCTGDGWVGYYAKADYRLGREARHEFNEDLAPEQADALTMSGCLMGNGLGFRAADTGAPAPFTRPAWAREIEVLEGPGRRLRSITGGEWWLEHPNDIDDLWQAEHARDELIKIIFSYWDYIKNRSAMRDRAATYALNHIPIMNAKRESRRLLGDYILTQNDCLEGRVFPDRIAYGGWPLDVHHPQGIFSGPEGSFHCNARVPIYTIPFRCLYSRNVENLLFAGRCASVTHIALGSIRVQSTLATLGQAAGTAAAMCAARDITPRRLQQDHMAELQQRLLRDDQTIPGLVNEDPADLARRATVRASSTAEFVLFGDSPLERDAAHPLDHDRGMVFPAVRMDRLRRLSLYLGNSTEAPVEVTLRVRGETERGVLASTTDLATSTASVPPGREGWVDFVFDLPVATPYLWFWLPKTAGLSWRLMSGAPAGCSRFYGNAAANAWTLREAEHYAFRPDPPLAVPARFAPEHVINGKAGMWDGETNQWASDPRQPLPQWIELAFPEPTELNAVYLTFDTNLAPSRHGAGRPPECVRDFTAEVRVGDAWQAVGEVTGNFQRRRILRFPTVRTDRLRLTVTATNGDPSARVFEARAYKE